MTEWRTGNGERFIGREWVLARIDSWLSAAESGKFLLSGEPGTGKSRLAQRLVEISVGTASADGLTTLGPGILAAHHACRATDDATIAPLRVVEALAKQLAARFTPFATALVQTLGQSQINVEQHVGRVSEGGSVTGVLIQVVGTVSARAAFDVLLRRPLQALAAAEPSRQVVVLIDALDESLGYPDPDGVVGLLDAAALPPQVRFLLTSRPDLRVTDRLGEPDLDLFRDQPTGVDDLRSYVMARLAEAPIDVDETRRDVLADRIVNKSEGIFLYARYVLDELLIDHANLSQESAAVNLPTGLAGIYGSFLEREIGRLGGPDREREWQHVYRPLLGALAVSNGEGLTRAQLVDVTGLDRSRVDDAVRAAAQYLDGVEADGPVRVYHSSFREYLLDDGRHCVYGAEANKKLVQALIERVPLRSGGPGRDWLRADDYTRAHLATHAADAGRLDDLVIDSGFLLAADSDRLLPTLARTARVEARQAANVYRTALHNLRKRSPNEAAAYLQLAARDDGADDLADSIDQLGIALPWSVPWARRTRVHPHLTLGAHVNRVAAVGVGDIGDQPVVVTGGADGTVRVWDLARGVQLHQLRGHSRGVNAIAVCAVNDLCVAVTGGHGDGIVQVWDLARGVPLHQLLGHPRGIGAVAVTTVNGRPVAVTGGSYDDGAVRVWDLAEGVQLHQMFGHGLGVNALAVTTVGGQPVAVTGSTDRTARVWDLSRGVQLQLLAGHAGRVNAVAVTAVGGEPVAVTGSFDGTARVWDLTRGDQRHLLCGTGHRVGVVAVCTANGQPVAVTGGIGDTVVWIWDVERGVQRQQLPGHIRGVGAITLAALEATPVAVTGGGSGDGTIRVWDIERGAQLHQLPGHSRGVSAIAVGSVDGRPIAVSGGGDGTVRLWDLLPTARAGNQANATDGTVGDVRALEVASLNGKPIAVTGGPDDESARVWDLANGTQLVPLPGHVHGVRAVAVTTVGGRTLAATGGPDDGLVRVWDLADGTQLHALPEHAEGVGAIAVGALDGHPIGVSGGGDGTVRVWDLADGAHLHTLTGHAQGVGAIAVGALDGHPIAVSGGGDGAVRVWDLERGTQRSQLLGHPHGVAAVAVTTVGGRPFAVTGGTLGDGVARVWDLADGTERHQLQTHTIGVNVISVGGPDDRRIAVTGGNYDSVVSVWDLAYGAQLHELPGHSEGVDAIAIDSVDDHPIAVVGSGYEDGTVRIWDLVTGNQLKMISVGPSIRVVAIDPRRTIVVGTRTGLVTLRRYP